MKMTSRQHRFNLVHYTQLTRKAKLRSPMYCHNCPQRHYELRLATINKIRRRRHCDWFERARKSKPETLNNDAMKARYSARHFQLVNKQTVIFRTRRPSLLRSEVLATASSLFPERDHRPDERSQRDSIVNTCVDKYNLRFHDFNYIHVQLPRAILNTHIAKGEVLPSRIRWQHSFVVLKYPVDYYSLRSKLALFFSTELLIEST